MNQLLKRQEKIFTNTVKVLVDTTIENFGPKDWIFIVEKTDEVYSRIDRRVFMIQRADKFIVESTEHKLRNNFFWFLKILKKDIEKQGRQEKAKTLEEEREEKCQSGGWKLCRGCMLTLRLRSPVWVWINWIMGSWDWQTEGPT